MANERLKSSSHRAGAWAIIHCTTTDKFLLGKRSSAVNNGGAWNFFGGRIDRGEGPCRALLRELAEEAGLRVKAKHLSKLRRVPAGGHKRATGRELHYYVLSVEHELAPRLNREHSSFGWFKRNRLPARFNLPTTVAIEQGLLNRIRA